MTQLLDTHNTWVVVPAYNESVYLDRVLSKLRKEWPRFVVVNDGSSDDTAQIARRHTPHVLSHAINLGKGAALKTGCEYVFGTLGAEAVIFFDGDDQHDPRLIHMMANSLKEYPVVLGVRSFNNKMPLVRILFNRLASLITLVFFGKYIPDIPSGFKGLTKAAYSKINWSSRDYLVEMEIAARVAQHKLPFVEVQIPTIYHDLDRGMTVLDILHMVGKIFTWKVTS